MKLKKLTIHNIASIEDAVIDFENGPLADDSRFLICGPTGAGKTTLLDAICLVLYGTTPRLNTASSEGYVDTDENFTLGNRNDIKIDDTRMLMRRGSLSAFVELIFSDKDDKTLKASWTCTRAHNKQDGNIKEPVWSLTDADDVVISSKKREILNMIEQRIGLTFEQFCRTTMLAQGDFTLFLKSSEGQKSDILEKLTGTAIYSEISKKIHEIKSEKENVCSQIKSRLEGVRMLSEDERNDILQKQSELKKRADQLQTEETRLNAIISWMDQLQKQEQQFAKACSDYDEQHKLMDTDEFKRDDSMVGNWQRTATLREKWNTRADALKLMAQHREKADELKLQYGNLCAGLLSLQKKEEEETEKKGKIETYLEAEKSKAESYRQINLIQSLVQRHKQSAVQINKARANVENKNKEISQLITSKEQQLEKVDKCAADADSKTKELDAKMQELQKMNYNGLLSQQQEKTKELNALKEYAALVELYARSHEAFLQKEKELGDIRKDISTYAEDVEKAETAERELDDQVARQQKIYDKQMLACKDVIKELRSSLTVGDICPLCGQKIHEITSEEQFKSVLQPVKECLDELKKKHADARKLLSDKKASLVQTKNTEKIRLSEYTVAGAKDKEVLAQKQCHIMFVQYKDSENPTDEIERRKSNIETYLKDIDRQLKTVGELQDKVSEMQKQKETVVTLLNKEKDCLKELDNKHSLAMNVITTEKESIETLKQTLTDIEKNMSQYISLDKYLSEGDSYILTIMTAAEKYHKAEDMLQTVEKSLQLTASALKHIGGLKSMIDEKHDEWKDIVVTEPVSIADVSTRWMQLQADVVENAQALKQSENIYSDSDRVLQEYFRGDNAVTEPELAALAQLPVSEIETLRRNLQNIRDKEISAKAEKNTAEQNLKTLKEGRPEFEEGLTYEAAADSLQNKKQETNIVNQQLGQNTQILNNDEADKKQYAEINTQLENANKELQQWSRLNDLFGSHDGKKFRNIAQSFVLEQLLVNANQYLRQFTDRYEMVCQSGSLTILLRDNEAGGVMRPTTTISGGESFLISLSLALGLSSLSRASFSVDTLFIDEGFGTLDSTYLSCVMDALERLHQMGGKKIGIISHVESLKERLTTQIQVSRVNSTLSKVKVVSII